MIADVDSPSSPGLRALLGRLLHGLLPYRLFQLVGAAWSYLMRLWAPSFPALLPSGWVVHRSVGPSELPEVLEALGLGPGPWDELEGCLKEFSGPAMEADLEMFHSLQGSWDCTLEELNAWQKAMVHSNMQTLWEPGLDSWEDPIQEEEGETCHRNACSDQLYYGASESKPCEGELQKDFQSCLGMVSYLLHTRPGGVFTLVNHGKDHSKQSEEVSCQSECEIEHIRSKRLWFLQQNRAPNALAPEEEAEPTLELSQSVSDTNQSVLPTQSSHNSHVSLAETPDTEEDHEILHQSHLLSDCNVTQREVLEVPGSDQELSPCDQLSALLHRSGYSDSNQNKYLPSPDQDQGYHSLEDWQCLNIAHHLKKGGIGDSEPREQDPCDVQCNMPKELSLVTGLIDGQDSDDVSLELADDLPVPSVPVCTNKHIGFILGTIDSSDDEDDPSSSSEEDDWDEDDGFDSEGSVSAAESDTPALEEAVWRSFTTPDPYNPNNFTASLQTGIVAEEHGLPAEEQEHVLSDEESWCDSDAMSDSDSEEDCSADEEENLKLWNAFLKSDDPYNPLYFTASVQTSKNKKQTGEIGSRYSKRTTPSNCELTVTSCRSADQHISLLKETSKVSIKERANHGCKKVTFHDKVTVHYVCSEEERKGHWEEFARDRCRFQRRIREIESMIGHCFHHEHRQRMWNIMHEKCSSQPIFFF